MVQKQSLRFEQVSYTRNQIRDSALLNQQFQKIALRSETAPQTVDISCGQRFVNQRSDSTGGQLHGRSQKWERKFFGSGDHGNRQRRQVMAKGNNQADHFAAVQGLNQ